MVDFALAAPPELRRQILLLEARHCLRGRRTAVLGKTRLLPPCEVKKGARIRASVLPSRDGEQCERTRPSCPGPHLPLRVATPFGLKGLWQSKHTSFFSNDGPPLWSVLSLTIEIKTTKVDFVTPLRARPP